MRPSTRISVHRPFPGALSGPAGYGPEAEDEEARFKDRPCYVFNRALPGPYDDKHCSHCRHYLTPRCPHIDEFLDDVDDLGSE